MLTELLLRVDLSFLHAACMLAMVAIAATVAALSPDLDDDSAAG